MLNRSGVGMITLIDLWFKLLEFAFFYFGSVYTWCTTYSGYICSFKSRNTANKLLCICKDFLLIAQIIHAAFGLKTYTINIRYTYMITCNLGEAFWNFVLAG